MVFSNLIGNAKKTILVCSLVKMELISVLPRVKSEGGKHAIFRKLKRVSEHLENSGTENIMK